MSKFSSPLAEHLYSLSLDSEQDEQIGSVDELGWFALFRGYLAILESDSQGFVAAAQFDNEETLQRAWDETVRQYEDYDAD